MSEAKPLRAGTRPLVYLAVAVLAVPIVLIGFAKTFFHPLATGAFRGDAVVYAHAALMFAWIGFVLNQTRLVHSRATAAHRRAGWLGLALVAGVVISTLLIGAQAARRVALGAGPEAAAVELFIVMIEMAVFGALIAAAVVLRRRPEAHRRLMLLALIASLGPAWFRFRHYFSPVENPAFVYSLLLADSLVLLAAASDLARTGRVHPVYLTAGVAMIGVHLIEVFLNGGAAFRAAARALAGPFI